MCWAIALITIFCIPTSFGQNIVTSTLAPYPVNLHNGLSEGIGNFSIEILYYTAKSLQSNENLIISPLTMWTVLAVVNEGASDNTSKQIRSAARISGPTEKLRQDFLNVAQWLQVNTATIELAKINTIFVDSKFHLERDFKDTAFKYYQTQVAPLNFTNKDHTVNLINEYVSNFTHGHIPSLVDRSNFDMTQMLLISALYFKGQWTSPFNASQTEKKPFYDSNGRSIGEVNMMYNRYTYPFANIKELEARVLELPYGKENRLSMLIMLPNPNISLQDMILKYNSVSFDKVFTELKISQAEYADDEVDCFIPRFKIKSDLLLNKAFMDMGIHDLFSPNTARLPKLARVPLYVSKVLHKAEIEVTEEGTTATAVTSVEFANRIGIVRFEANRPFAYMIIEKVTNSIVFGGIYRQPSLY